MFRSSPTAIDTVLIWTADKVISLLGLLAFLLPFIIICIAISLDSPGSPIYIQKRIRRHGRVFHIVKFRTMHVGSARGLIYDEETDLRITRVGRFLRRSKFDEFPQLANVLMGHMSLVGPRPIMVEVHRQYLDLLPGYIRRNDGCSGITGMAILRGNECSHPQGIEAGIRAQLKRDCYWNRHRTFGLYCLVLLHTAGLVVRKVRRQNVRTAYALQAAE